MSLTIWGALYKGWLRKNDAAQSLPDHGFRETRLICNIRVHWEPP